MKFQRFRQMINISIYEKCNLEGFNVLDNENIFLKHLWNDGLHLNKVGSKFLKQNILGCFTSFNPYLCDFDFSYEDDDYRYTGVADILNNEVTGNHRNLSKLPSITEHGSLINLFK